MVERNPVEAERDLLGSFVAYMREIEPSLAAEYEERFCEPAYLPSHDCARCGAHVLPAMREQHTAYHRHISMTIWFLGSMLNSRKGPDSDI